MYQLCIVLGISQEFTEKIRVFLSLVSPFFREGVILWRWIFGILTQLGASLTKLL